MLDSLIQESDTFLILENGEIFRGCGIGITGLSSGEIVFNTSMTGYQEIITDPSYAGQIISFSTSHIGNVGVNYDDQEDCYIHAKGVIASSISQFYSNWRAKGSLVDFLQKNEVMGISNIDTRALNTIIRNVGSLWGCIFTKNITVETAMQHIATTKAMGVGRTKEAQTLGQGQKTTSGKRKQVVLYNFGVKSNIIKMLQKYGCDIEVVPYNATIQEILELNPSAVVLSNGPGDPMDYQEAIINTRNLISNNIPILGICLGHQILGIAAGAKTYKMKFGHHGANHPVLDIRSNSVLISSQNHNYAIEPSTLPNCWSITHRSLFDGSIQGIRHLYQPFMGFQGHPEGSPGTHDLYYLFNEFTSIIDNKKNFHNNSPENLSCLKIKK